MTSFGLKRGSGLAETRPRYPRGGGVLDISLGGEVRRGPTNPDPV